MTDDLVKRLREPVDDPFFGKLVEPIKCEAATRIEKLEKILRELVCDCAIDCPHFRDPLPSCMCYGAFPKEKKND